MGALRPLSELTRPLRPFRGSAWRIPRRESCSSKCWRRADNCLSTSPRSFSSASTSNERPTLGISRPPAYPQRLARFEVQAMTYQTQRREVLQTFSVIFSSPAQVVRIHNPNTRWGDVLVRHAHSDTSVGFVRTEWLCEHCAYDPEHHLVGRFAKQELAMRALGTAAVSKTQYQIW